MKNKKIKAQPACPECEKLSKVSEQSNKIGDFLDWLRQHSIVLCVYDDGEEAYFDAGMMTDSGINHLLAKYFGIDLDKVEEERKALLQWFREIQK